MAFGRRFLDGALAPWRGLVHLGSRPRLWAWIAAPIVVFLVLVIPTAVVTWRDFPSWIAAIAPPPSVDALAGLWLLAVRVLWLVLFVGVAAVEWVVASALTRPAYALVTEMVEAELGSDEGFDLGILLGDAGWSVVHSGLAMLLYLAMTGVVAGLALVPAIGEVLAPAIAGVTSVFWLARELVDGPLSHRRAGFATKVRFLWRYWPEMLGLGVATWLGLLVPVLDLVVLPAAYVGATLWYVRTRAALARGSAED
jgi:CysZ protein